MRIFCHPAGASETGNQWEILKCHACGYGATHPPVRGDELSSHYPPLYLGDVRATLDQYGSGKLQKSRSWRNQLEKVALVESYCEGGRLLDVGAADGKFLLALDGNRWRRNGVEPIPEVAEMVSGRFPEIELKAGQFDSFDCESDLFEAITFWHVLEHLPDPAGALGRVRNLLAPGGWVFLSVPNFHSYQAEWFREHWYSLDVPRHLHHFSPRSLELLLAGAGLRFREHLYFSRDYNVHQLKHSTLAWSRARFSSRVPYYFIKPLLLLWSHLEGLTRRYGVVTTIAQR